MDILTDTNIILRLAEPAHPMHPTALAAVKKLFTDGHDLCLIPQNLIEFWNAATRPADKNGLGWTTEQADEDVRGLESTFTILPDSPDIYPEWRHLVVKYSVLGKQVHDARIAAAINVNQITNLLTFNGDDFKRFPDIVVIDPTAI